MHAQISKSSQFVERWATAEYTSRVLRLALICVSLVTVVISCAFVYVSVRPQPIYYVPGVWEAGMARPQQTVPKSAVASFVSSWVLNWTNFTPVTVLDAYKRAQNFMSPYLLGQTKARLTKDLEEVKHNNISSMFSLNQEPIISEDNKGYSVILKGGRGIYMGKEEIRLQQMTYHIKVRVVNPTDKNPYGLMIDDVDQEVSQ